MTDYLQVICYINCNNILYIVILDEKSPDFSSLFDKNGINDKSLSVLQEIYFQQKY